MLLIKIINAFHVIQKFVDSDRRNLSSIRITLTNRLDIHTKLLIVKVKSLSEYSSIDIH